MNDQGKLTRRQVVAGLDASFANGQVYGSSGGSGQP